MLLKLQIDISVGYKNLCWADTIVSFVHRTIDIIFLYSKNQCEVFYSKKWHLFLLNSHSCQVTYVIVTLTQRLIGKSAPSALGAL